MIRVIQRRIIIPRGDTGVFTIPAITQAEGAIGVFTIFDPITNTRIFQKQVEIEGENFNISFSHADTVNLQAGNYLWDIKFYKNPILADNKVIDGEEINSYYAAFQAPKCEIRETGDDFLMIEGQPAKIEDLNIILAATEAANAAKVAATEQAEEAAVKLEEMMAAMPTKVSELENDSGYLQEETDPTVPAWAKAAEKPAYTAQEVGALPVDTVIPTVPTNVSAFTNDAGYLTMHQDISMKANSADLAAVATSGSYEDLNDKPTIPEVPVQDVQVDGVSMLDAQGIANVPIANSTTLGVVKVRKDLDVNMISDSSLVTSLSSMARIKEGTHRYSHIKPVNQHVSVFYGLAKAAGSDEKNSELPVGQYTDAAKAAIQQMLDVPSTADIPTNVSAFTNDAGYLTQHQDISGKANAADLAAVATSGSYEDLSDKPTIPEVPVQDVQVNGTSVLNDGVANIPRATASTFGVISIPGASGGGLKFSDNKLVVAKATTAQIKAGENDSRPITPSDQHISTFYGLAKAAGDATQSQSDNAVGTYTDSAKAAIQTMLDVPSTSAVTSEIAAAIGNINSFDMAVVQALPTEDISTHTIYLVPKTGETNDVYDEYVYINNAWEMVGNTQVDLSNYVQKTDYASYDEAGVVKISSTKGLAISSDGTIQTSDASVDELKAGTNRNSIVSPRRIGQATFYGLAKAAGDTTQSQSDNAIGTYTTEAKAAIRSMIGAAASADLTVQDVQINGSSILSNGIADIPYADSANSGGIVRANYNFGITYAGAGLLSINCADETKIKTGTNAFFPIVPYFQHAATFYGLAKAAGDTTQSQSDNAVGTYTAEAKAAIQTMLDVPSTSDIPDVSIYATKADTILDTTLSIGRLADSDVGENSIALGYDVTASGDYSFATGSETIASSDSAHAEGENTQATDSAAHAEGTYTQATGYASHAEGDSSVANGWFSHAEGSETAASGRSTHVFGERNFNTNKYPSENNEQRGTMVEIVGNGYGNGYSNARALTWTGDEYLAGNLYVNADATSTTGTRVATVTELAAKLDAAEAGLKVVRLI